MSGENKIPVLVSFIGFYPDNYQGGSGKHLEGKTILLVSPDESIEELKNLVFRELNSRKNNEAKGWQDASFEVKNISIF